MRANWFSFNNAGTSAVDLHIIDTIAGDDESSGMTVSAFLAQLRALPRTVQKLVVHVNSPGGDAVAGLNITHALRSESSKGRIVETVIDGLAASIASVIAMAGRTVLMADNAVLMIHSPVAVMTATASGARQVAGTLDSLRDQMVTAYQWHSHLSAAELTELCRLRT